MGSGFGQQQEFIFSVDTSTPPAAISSDEPNIQKADGTPSISVSYNIDTPADLGKSFKRYYKRDNLTGPNTVTYDIKLKCVSGHSLSPFYSAAQTVEVQRDPRADFTFAMRDNPTGHSNYDADNIGFNFRGYDGIEYNWATFTDASENVNNWLWDFDNDGSTNVTGQGPHDYQLTTAQTYGSKLIASSSAFSDDFHHPTASDDDTEIKTSTIIINPAPAEPAGLAGKTLNGFPTSVGDNPKLVTGFTSPTTDTTNTYSAGDSLNRQVGTNALEVTQSDWASKFPSNGDLVGSLDSMVNGSSSGNIVFDITSQVTTVGDLVITDDVDSNSLNQPTYPLNFYRQFKAKISKSNTPRGVNTYKLQYTNSIGTQETNLVTWVHDSLTDFPTTSSFSLTEASPGTLRYMSGIPYYNSGASVTVNNLTVSNISGETYRDSSDFLTIENSTGTIINSQTSDYLTTLGQAIPNKDTGVGSAQSINTFDVNLNGSTGKGLANIQIKAKNVNGESSFVPSSTNLRYWKSSVPLDETAMDNSVIRIYLNNWTGEAPVYSAANFTSTSPYASNTDLSGKPEVVVNFDGEIEHNVVNYSNDLPVGPDYSSGRSGVQYFTVAWNSILANFRMKFTGEIASAWAIIPGVSENYSVTYNSNITGATTSPSGLSGNTNGWVDMASQYGGVGIPGFPQTNGSNGTVGLDNSLMDGSTPLVLNTPGTYNSLFTWGSINGSTSGNKSGCQVVRIGIAAGKSISNFELIPGG